MQVVGPISDIMFYFLKLSPPGLNKLQRTMNLSVSEFVIHHSTAPILIIPTAHVQKNMKEGWELTTTIKQVPVPQQQTDEG